MSAAQSPGQGLPDNLSDQAAAYPQSALSLARTGGGRMERAKRIVWTVLAPLLVAGYIVLALRGAAAVVELMPLGFVTFLYLVVGIGGLVRFRG